MSVCSPQKSKLGAHPSGSKDVDRIVAESVGACRRGLGEKPPVAGETAKYEGFEGVGLAVWVQTPALRAASDCSPCNG